MKQFNRELLKITGIFILWRVVLILFLFIAIQYIPLAQTDRFLGGGSINYVLSPQLFSWGNFDGEHYLAISIFGYKPLEQAFFPIFPMLISFLTKPFSYDLMSNIVTSTIVGLLISNIAFFLSLVFLWKLLRIDYSEKISFLTLLIIVLFPTSFYFASLYNESLFLLLSVFCFLSARKNHFFLAAIFGGLASSTRVFGILLLPALLIEIYQRKIPLSKSFWIFLIPVGLISYMIYQYISVGDPIAFYNLQKVVGEQHQSGIVLLPQVYYRYIKILFTLDMQSPIYQTILLEFFTGILFFLLPIYGYFKKIRLSYIFYSMSGFLLPTIQGSFSSSPRYVIILFPAFLALALFIENKSKIFKAILLICSLGFLFIETLLFLRGYWVA